VLADILNANGADTPAASLSVIRGFLSDSGIKPVSDSPAHQRLARAYEALPFTDADEQRSEKARPMGCGVILWRGSRCLRITAGRPATA
jgi:hypothetical protein